jgi:hypothetical protein
LSLPLAAVSAVSILIGGGAAWVYTTATIGRSDALIALKDVPVDTAIPAWVALGCILSVFLMTQLFAFAMLRRIGGASPLALLQSGK